MTMDEIERAMIQKSLRHHGGNISSVAESLGLSRAALYRRLEKYEIPAREPARARFFAYLLVLACAARRTGGLLFSAAPAVAFALEAVFASRSAPA